MSRIETTEEWILEDLAAITGKDIKELRKSKSKSKSTPVNRHKYFRRPGKRHNKDFCFSCCEGGTLICCDGCIKSFHLLCLDPPMEEEDIPEGEWLCKTCKLNAKTSTESDSDYAVSLSSHKRKLSSDDDSDNENKLMKAIWSLLIKRAIESDPKEYRNPLDCRTIPYIFPGDSKNCKRTSFKTKQPHSSQCYICNKGVSKQSMVNCDYCERSFHLDCTDPPLTVPPKYFWMCQFHIEPCLENIMFQDGAPSLSQRIALWDMCRKPIDHETVKLEFLRNTVKDKSKIIQLPTIPIEIPDAVYHHYNNRPDMIPSLKDALRLVGYEQSINYLNNLPSKKIKLQEELKNSITEIDKTSAEDQELWLSTILEFHKDIISKMNLKTNENIIKIQENKIDKIKTCEIENVIDDNIIKDDNESVISKCSTSSSADKTDKINKIKKPHDEITKILQSAVSELPEADECLNIMNYLDDEFINLLAFQRLGQLINYNKINMKLLNEKKIYEQNNSIEKETKNLTNTDLEKYIGRELERTSKNDEFISLIEGDNYTKIDKDKLKSIIDDKNDINLPSTSNEKVIKIENDYTEEIDSVTEQNDKKSSNETKISNDDKKMNEIQIKKCEISNDIKIKNDIEYPIKNIAENNILAVLTGVDKQTKLYPIYKSGFIIGTGNNVDLDLTEFNFCNYLSKQHAIVFFDSSTHLWELINYSRYGCKVNNVIINFDVPKKALQNILDSDSDDESCDFHDNIKSISNKQSELIDSKVILNEREISIMKFNSHPCDCNPNEILNNMSVNGWNNSVPFSHGSLLQFGCIKLLFADTSYVTS